MNIFRLAAELFILYILYKFIFDFIIPIYTTTRKVKQQFGEMHEKMQEQMNAQNKRQAQNPTPKQPSSDEYIDYEEVK
jgi:sortase (surface protein transpeptidase)